MSVVQFYLWFEFFFSFVSNSLFFHYHTLRYPKTKENKFKPMIKLNYNTCMKSSLKGCGGGKKQLFFLPFFVVFFCPQTHKPPLPRTPQAA